MTCHFHLFTAFEAFLTESAKTTFCLQSWLNCPSPLNFGYVLYIIKWNLHARFQLLRLEQRRLDIKGLVHHFTALQGPIDWIGQTDVLSSKLMDFLHIDRWIFDRFCASTNEGYMQPLSKTSTSTLKWPFFGWYFTLTAFGLENEKFQARSLVCSR